MCSNPSRLEFRLLIRHSSCCQTMDEPARRQRKQGHGPHRPVRESFPETDPCYSSSSSLVIGGSKINSTRGVQQGDPLGSALCALAIHPVLLKARSLTTSAFPGSVDLSPFFLDDGVLAGDAPAISSFLSLELLS